MVGAGNIGRQVARKVQAFGASTQYYNPYRLTPAMEEEFKLRFTSLDEVLKTSSLITLHVPLTDANHHMINAERISEMKDGAIIINTARGGLIDDHALAEAVKIGKLSGARLDGVEREPLEADDELLTTPIAASSSKESAK